MTMEAIKEAITELPAQERTTLLRWLAEQDSLAWEKQMEADFSGGGTGTALFAQWASETEAGDSIPREELFRPRNTKGAS